MRLTIDTGKCSGHARCWEAAPDVFDIDDNGYALPLDVEVSDPPADSIRAGIAACPERAISLH
ncbi:ferredoxin [Rhodococcus sp. Z13]|uniref:Ferredoxin n=1 Tax=Rhodococcus sacchari TaxID=2962047 RepID=A0ACD4DGA9_9NOCA|nr:ferredoxin [Rhodococcus sp. Z13]UYP19071.1 ferredoxin [Rhodococcus sp. Z13]